MPANVNAYALSYTTMAEQITMYGMLQGQGAAAPIIPPTATSNTSSAGFCQASLNCLSTTASDHVRTSAGNYTTKIQPTTPTRVPPLIFDVGINVWGTTGLWASIVDFNPSTGVLTFKTFSAAGSATDMATTDFAHLTFTCQQSIQAK